MKSDADHLIAHTVSAGAIVGAVIGWLPIIAAFVGLLWYATQLWESKTVQSWEITKWVRRMYWHHVRHQPVPDTLTATASVSVSLPPAKDV